MYPLLLCTFVAVTIFFIYSYAMICLSEQKYEKRMYV